MSSIRRRLVVSLLAGSGLLILSAGLIASAVVARRLRHEFDRSLLAKAQALVTLTAQQDGEVEIHFADELMPEFEAPSRPEYFQLRLADGALIERSRSLRGSDLPRFENLSNAPVYRDLKLPDGRPGRLVEIAFVPQTEEGESETALDPAAPPGRLLAAVLSVARGREQLDSLIRSLYLATLATAALLLASLALLVHFSVKIGLSPLAEIGRQVQALDADRLDSRVAVQPSVRELSPVVEQINGLLNRLQAAFERERRFSSDVAHELRTPVAELRNLAEVGARWPEDREAVRAFFTDVTHIARQMEGTVGTLLTLARCEAGIERMERGEVSVSELLADAWEPFTKEAAARNLRFDLAAPPRSILTDPTKLRLIVTNLFSNAVTYSPSGSTVSCTARADDGTLEITVANPAPNLTSDDLPYLFERFWRKDAARSNGQHAGLGLALARSCAALLDYELTADLDPDRQLKLRLMGPVGTGP